MVKHEFHCEMTQEYEHLYELGSAQGMTLGGLREFTARCSCGWVGINVSDPENAKFQWETDHLTQIWSPEEVRTRKKEQAAKEEAERRQIKERKDVILAKFVDK